MLIKPSLIIDIPKEEPFKHDVLDRENVAESLTDMLECITEPFVLSFKLFIRHRENDFSENVETALDQQRLSLY